ncbi:uncharacterized protein [Dermacentor albipictus]|uniref:uncharacterized protein n=1 Tax=Dermacentor albipictus TaxID=60249 RepID=UPI0038FD059E
MSGYCSVPQCRLYATEPGVSLHTYPQDKQLRDREIQNRQAAIGYNSGVQQALPYQLSHVFSTARVSISEKHLSRLNLTNALQFQGTLKHNLHLALFNGLLFLVKLPHPVYQGDSASDATSHVAHSHSASSQLTQGCDEGLMVLAQVATSFDERSAQASLPTPGLSGLGAGLYSQTTFEQAAMDLEYETAVQTNLSEPGPSGLSTSVPIEPQLAQAAMDTGDNSQVQESLYVTDPSSLAAVLQLEVTPVQAAMDLEYETAVQTSLSEPGPSGLSTSVPIEPQLAQAAMDTGDNSQVQESLYVTDPSSLAAVLQLEVTPVQKLQRSSNVEAALTTPKKRKLAKVDTPEKAFLRARAARLASQQQQSRKAIKRLQQSRRRLQKQNAELKSVLKTLTTQNILLREQVSVLDSLGAANQQLLQRQFSQKTFTNRCAECKHTEEAAFDRGVGG